MQFRVRNCDRIALLIRVVGKVKFGLEGHNPGEKNRN